MSRGAARTGPSLRAREGQPPAGLLRRAGLDAIGAELRDRLAPADDPVAQLAALSRSAAMSDPHDGFRLAADEPTLVRMMVAIATMGERQAQMIKSGDAAHTEAAERHRELMARIDTFVPRAEIEKDNRALTARIDGLDERVKKIEAGGWKLIAWVLGIVGSAVAGLFTVKLKGG